MNIQENQENQEMLNKVLKGLESCKKVVCPDDCPYSELGDIDGGCYGNLINDTIALLQAQEPQIMELNDLAVTGDIIWFEQGPKHPTVVPAILADVRYETLFGKESNYAKFSVMGIGCTYTRDVKNYNKTWRCWTAKPTDAQMKAIPWNGEIKTLRGKAGTKDGSTDEL